MPAPPLSIVQSLSPRVAVLASDDVVDSCAANGCRGLDELLRPWQGGTERVSILSSTLTPTVHPTFPLRFVSYASVYSNPQHASPNPDMVVDLIGACVGKRKPDEDQQYPLARSLLLSSRPLAAHETFNHPVGVMFAISTSTPDPMGTLTRLYGQAVGTGAQAAPWMDGVQVLKFFVVVHDVSKKGADLKVAHELLATVKKAYGPHSTLLVVNSREEVPQVPPKDLPDGAEQKPAVPSNPSAISQVYASAMSSFSLSPIATVAVETEKAAEGQPPKHYADKLSSDDVERLIALVRELVVQSLVPWMEARIREWSEQYQSNRRGLTGRLFGAGRKLFGGSRPSSPSPAAGHAGYNPIKGYYPVNSIEALSRRLADFSFMLRDYRYASTVYDSLRRDYAQDRAWRYAAAATEMYGLSQLLSNTYFLPNTPPHVKPAHFTNVQHSDISGYLEQAVLAYLDRSNPHQIQLDALRITVLYYEAWKVLNEWRRVGQALVRAAGEADEVPCAILIEEAASADTKGGKTQRGQRRQAFHLVMAARRYEKAGLKHYSGRCLARASDLLKDAPWQAARDRIEYSLGRQAYTLGASDIAVEHFLRLLVREDTGVPGSQAMVLEDLALAYEHLCAQPDKLEAVKDKLKLPTPVIDKALTRVVLPVDASSLGSSSEWSDLESLALTSWDRKGKKPMSLLPDRRRIVVAVGETFLVELTATNPLNSPVVLTNLTVGVEPAESAGVETIDEVVLDPYETRQISLTVKLNAAGAFKIATASFLFHRFFPCVEPLERRGPRLHATKAQRLTPTYANDTTLSVHAEDKTPRLRAELLGVPSSVYEGEVVQGEIRLHNCGLLPVENVQLVTNEYGVISLRDTSHSDTSLSIPNIIQRNSPLTLYSGTIEPGEHKSVPVTFNALPLGVNQLLGLTYFSTPDGSSVGGGRLSSVVEVRRLLTVVPSWVSPARTGYLVAVDVTNVADVAVELTSLSTVSQYWQGTPTTPNGLIYPNQTCRTVIRVTAPDTCALDFAQLPLVANLRHLLRHEEGGLQPISPAEVTMKLPDAHGAYLISRRAHRLRFAAVYLPTLSAELVPSVLPLFEPLDLDVAVTWQTGSRSGYATAHGLSPAPHFSLVDGHGGLRSEADGQTRAEKRTMYEETGRLRRALVDSVLDGVYALEENPVITRVRVPSAVRGEVFHDFETGPLTVPVTIELENRSPFLSARWIVRLPGPQQSIGSVREGTAAPVFVGSLSHRGVLAPGEKTSIDTGVWLVEPALTSLGGWEILTETGDECAAEAVAEGADGEKGEAKGESDKMTPQSPQQDATDNQATEWFPRANWRTVADGPSLDVGQA